MNRRASFRGQPLLLLAGLVLGWVGVRAALWEAPGGGEQAALGMVGQQGRLQPSRSQLLAPTGRSAPEVPSLSSEDWLRAPLPSPLPARPGWNRLPRPGETPLYYRGRGQLPPVVLTDGPPRRSAGASPATLIGGELLMVAGLSQLEVPAELVAYLQPAFDAAQASARTAAGAASGPITARPAPAGTMPAGPAAVSPSRWSGDAWLLLRDDTTTPFTSGRPSYGRSQAGAVLRYRLAANSRFAPQAHLRASTALEGAREQEVAAGLSMRPVPGLPVRVAAELRINDNGFAGTRARPAIFAVTELPPVSLPLGARGEAYLQGGYVGGDFATGFVDGQARVDRPLLRIGDGELAVGGAAWGGAQQGSERVDVGPSTSLTFGIGRMRGRIAADYRFRVAGNAEPSSGPALTIAAGF